MGFSYVFWTGDLNFRLNTTFPASTSEIIDMIKENSLNILLNEDELKRIQSSGEAFSELLEGNIKFKPTYKYRHGTDEYDLL